MKTPNELKEIVRNKYSEIAEMAKPEESSCCGTIPCCDNEIATFSDDYANQPGYNKDADLALGCGIPTDTITIREGDTVVDLGSGAGNDAFVARALVGASGKIIGIDMTETMIAKARLNNDKLNYNNVEFRLGEIENLPLNDNTTDVIISNCVLNLVPNKGKAFQEILRTLKPGGKFSISDIVIEGNLPEKAKEIAELYAGCVSGAIQKDDYLDIIKSTGFNNVEIKKEKEINIPTETLSKVLNEKELKEFQEVNAKIISITVTAEKK
ncbi:MAG: arsenite methyltransferase [Ignavibacteriae bacterium]|nr:arsenite methyltransferase [Ignavibacteriota bacterium]